MATTKIWAVHSRLDHLVNYVANPDKTANAVFDDLHDVLEYAEDEYKTEQKYFVSGVNCNPTTAYSAMCHSLTLSNKSIKVLGYHGYQSFKGQEATPEQAHEIGMKLAQELWGDKFQVVVATHGNTDNIHNHFVLCSTSFINGSRYHDCKETYQTMRDVSDRLCREYGLSVVENTQPGKTRHYAEWKAEQLDKPTWRGIVKADVDKAISQSLTDKQFFHHLRKMGYQYKVGKDISVCPPGKERFFRLARNLGEAYSLDGIRQKILQNDVPKKETDTEQKKSILIMRLRGEKKDVKKIGGLRGLYLHYCYLLGVIPKKMRTSPARLHFLLREDLTKLDNIINETKLLTRNNITTGEQLSAFRSQLGCQIAACTDERKLLRAELRRADTPARKETLKHEIASLSAQLTHLRKEVTLCDNIAQRSGLMTEKMNTIKEEQTHEHRRRRSRTTGTHEPKRR